MTTRRERLQEIDAVVFRTITGADWAREIARARATPNAVRDQIKIFLAGGIGKMESEKAGKISTESCSTI